MRSAGAGFAAWLGTVMIVAGAGTLAYHLFALQQQFHFGPGYYWTPSSKSGILIAVALIAAGVLLRRRGSRR